MIKERVDGGHGVTVCGRQTSADTATYSDEETVYLSDSNSVEIRVIAARSTKDGRQFLLRYKGQQIDHNLAIYVESCKQDCCAISKLLMSESYHTVLATETP